MIAPLEASDLSVGYRSRAGVHTILSNINLSVAPGELVCLLGPNGAGKSTLLRTFSGIQKPLAGEVRLSGVEIQRIGPAELARHLGLVLTERVQVGALPAYRIVELGRYSHLGWSGRLGPHDHQVVQWAIDAVGAGHLAHRDSNELSDGERQRIMIARALAQEPGLLLLDEPTAFLDVPSRVELMGLLRNLAREQGLAIVVSSHDLELALRMADTVWLVSADGAFHAGAPEDLVVDGEIARVFTSGRISFSPEERAFRLTPVVRGQAKVKGEGLTALLAAAVLEREGYELVGSAASGAMIVTAEASSCSWRARTLHEYAEGQTFASLAAFARRNRDLPASERSTSPSDRRATNRKFLESIR